MKELEFTYAIGAGVIALFILAEALLVSRSIRVGSRMIARRITFAIRTPNRRVPVIANGDDVHVDWHMTREEWRQLGRILVAHYDVPYIADLIRDGKIPDSEGADIPPSPRVTEALGRASDAMAPRTDAFHLGEQIS